MTIADAKAAFENIHSAIGERGLLNLTAKIQQLCRDGIASLTAATPVAYAYEYEEFNGQWMRGVIMATEGGSGRLCAPPKTHDSKPVRNVRPLYSH